MSADHETVIELGPPGCPSVAFEANPDGSIKLTIEYGTAERLDRTTVWAARNVRAEDGWLVFTAGPSPLDPPA